jgi:hypothetical protein
VRPESRLATLGGLFFALVLGTGPIVQFWHHRADPQASWATIALNSLLLLVSGVIGVVAHEAAHALVARAVGLHVESVVIGVGPVVWEWSNGDNDVELRAVPFGGGVTVTAPSRRWLRARLTAMILAGPMANVVLLAPFLHIFPDGKIALEHFYCHPQPKDAFLLANALLAMSNLAPIPPTDAWYVLILPFRGRRFFAEYVSAHLAMRAAALMDAGRIAEAKALIDKVLTENPLSKVASCVRESLLEHIEAEHDPTPAGCDPDASSASPVVG